MDSDLQAAVVDLSSEDVFVRTQAMATLQRHPDEGRGLTVAALRDPDASERARVWAALTLGQIGDDDAREVAAALREALRDAAPAVRWAALGSLGKLGDAANRDAIVAHLHDDDAVVSAWVDDEGGDEAADAASTDGDEADPPDDADEG